MSSSCVHRICRQAPKGVAVCIVDPKNRKVLLGLERFGKYRGKFNLCAGSLEPEDEGCAVNAAKRELREEFKLDVHDFNRYFGLHREDVLRLAMVGPTPVLIGHFDVDTLHPDALTREMKTAIDDESLPGTHKEMEEAQWFPWEDHDTMTLSRFARVALKKILYRASSRYTPQKVQGNSSRTA